MLRANTRTSDYQKANAHARNFALIAVKSVSYSTLLYRVYFRGSRFFNISMLSADGGGGTVFRNSTMSAISVSESTSFG